ncbi:hypothetical protein ABK905_19885 [Acerihabitans sp. KWT182]|uniref:Uncharacterized protein n=1 Tax=Acerihabitans sp. KWT182 TaxID=3157919 RepID=A0AAU7Q6V0_9GAMM
MEETLFDCALDIASLIPVVGQMNRLSVKSGTLFLQGLHTAGRNALSMAAARYTMKEIASKSAKTLMVKALQPASKIVSLKEVSALAKNTARLMDPGFEIIYFVGKKSFNQVASAGRQMGKSLPKLKALFDRTTDAPRLAQQPGRIGPIFIAAEQGTGRKIDLQPLVDQKYRGRAVYAMTNLETGVPFGPKFFLTNKNHFRAIPVKFSSKIQTVLQQGLGGRGAPPALRPPGAPIPTMLQAHHEQPVRP